MEISYELDEDTGEEDIKSEGSIFAEVQQEFQETLNQIEKYKKSKLLPCDFIINPAIKYLNNEVFVILYDILEQTLFKAIETGSLQYHKSPFNPMDFIAEQLWNLNPNHLERRDNWISVFDLDWVKDYLAQHKRPYFPFSWIWNREYAALKIQSFMRGYWVRRREDVQEVRQFWKALKDDRREAKELEDIRSPYCECITEDVCSQKEILNISKN